MAGLRAVGSVLALAAFLAPAGPAKAVADPAPPVVDPPTVRIIPGTPPADRTPRFALPPPRPDRKPADRIVYAFDGPARAFMEYRPDLTRACRAGRFGQRITLLYRAFGPGETPLGVAYGQATINLVDPDGLREVDKVYFFDKQDTARCAVYAADKDALSPYFVGP